MVQRHDSSGSVSATICAPFGKTISNLLTNSPYTNTGLPVRHKQPGSNGHVPFVKASEPGCFLVVQSPKMKVSLDFIWRSRSQSLEEEWRGPESTLLDVLCEVSSQ
ncbi:hypothetical protein ATANTOWER_025754 [Ataeniobius toweri]|uniref:Uncharacterized protein n=1 Tax=Ataeniobius toweri TaxID=208326 RepID=A0ABU7BAU0_9TELE|nr:hypothetical protein [Ataeniobius toweri]